MRRLLLYMTMKSPLACNCLPQQPFAAWDEDGIGRICQVDTFFSSHPALRVVGVLFMDMHAVAFVAFSKVVQLVRPEFACLYMLQR